MEEAAVPFAEHVTLAELSLRDIDVELTQTKDQDAATSVATALQCVVCMTRERAVACVPCGHKCLCKECGKRDVVGGKCPMCRESVKLFMEVFE